MSSIDMLDVGQANELKLAMRRNGCTAEDLKWLCEGTRLWDLRNVRLGNALIAYPDHYIDLSEQPLITKEFNEWSRVSNPDWRVVIYHTGRKFGCDPRFKWDPARVKFKQHTFLRGKTDYNDQLMDLAKNERVFNTNLLDHLLTHPHLIPKSWKRHTIVNNVHCIPLLFIGTIYQLSGDKRYCVRGMTYKSGYWVEAARDIGGVNSEKISFAIHV